MLVMEGMQIERISMVGGGRHMRLRLRRGRFAVNGIYFSASPESASVAQGDIVDVAFIPQINEFRGERSVQMNVVDIRPNCKAACSPEAGGYRQLCEGQVSGQMAQQLLPDRNTLAMVWRYLASVPGALIRETPMCLCRKIVRWSGMPLNLGKLLVCLDIFADVELVRLVRMNKFIEIGLIPCQQKADLNRSRTLQRLLQVKES